MKITDSIIGDVKIIQVESLRDDRGEFSRVFCDESMRSFLKGRSIKQINRSITRSVGSIRGLHFQFAPYAELKIVRCLKGKVFDVAVDLRANSATFLQWIGIELSPTNNNALAIPEGFAHGFQALEENSELLYLHTSPYVSTAEGAVRYDDPLIGISWPMTPTKISQRDLLHPYLEESFKGVLV